VAQRWEEAAEKAKVLALLDSLSTCEVHTVSTGHRH
jgi:hypothetical protein